MLTLPRTAATSLRLYTTNTMQQKQQARCSDSAGSQDITETAEAIAMRSRVRTASTRSLSHG